VVLDVISPLRRRQPPFAGHQFIEVQPDNRTPDLHASWHSDNVMQRPAHFLSDACAVSNAVFVAHDARWWLVRSVCLLIAISRRIMLVTSWADP